MSFLKMAVGLKGLDNYSIREVYEIKDMVKQSLGLNCEVAAWIKTELRWSGVDISRDG